MRHVSEKIFYSWKQFSKTQTMKLLEVYIKTLIMRGERHRLSHKLGIVPDAQLKYEATHSTVLILLGIHQEMENNDIFH